jgi:hypothetical protein
VEGGKKGLVDKPKSTLVLRGRVERPSFVGALLLGLPTVSLFVLLSSLLTTPGSVTVLVTIFTLLATVFGPRALSAGAVVG